MSSSPQHEIVDHLFRKEYGKLVSTLTRIFGLQNIELAEDIVQETLLSALDHWSVGNIPENPAAWIMLVAKRKALNELSRNKTIQNHLLAQHETKYTSVVDEIFLDEEIEDSQLRMIFTCCHPALTTESQIALTLKTLCGFGTKQVAKALLTNESTINKRLYRAKQQIRESKIDFSVPLGIELDQRIKNVNLTLYLLFNEGYNSTNDDAIIQKDLCLEAIRLAQLLARHFNEHKESKALLSLMCLHAARFDARIDKNGTIIIFEDQDRSKWNRQLISTGIALLNESADGESLSAYHLEAGIAAEHCLAEDFSKTNWRSIYRQYEMLYRLKGNPIIQLNLAIIKSQLDGINSSLEALLKLTQVDQIKNYYLLPVTQGIFYMKQNKPSDASKYLNQARGLATSKIEIKFIDKKLADCAAMRI